MSRSTFYRLWKGRARWLATTPAAAPPLQENRHAFISTRSRVVAVRQRTVAQEVLSASESRQKRDGNFDTVSYRALIASRSRRGETRRSRIATFFSHAAQLGLS
jgi:hypothetical protein